MKTYSVRRSAVEHILKYRQQQKVASLALLKDIVNKESSDEKYIMILCEYLIMLNQYTNMIKKILDGSAASKIPLSESQLALIKVFNTAVRALEASSVEKYNLSLQNH